MYDVDLHIICMPDREHYQQELLVSLEGQPCNIHISTDYTGVFGEGRGKGFSLGSAPYVAYADDDDLVEPGAIQACLDALNNNPNAVGAYTDEILITEDGKYCGPGQSTGKPYTPKRQLGMIQAIHHIWVAKREFIMPYLDFISDIDSPCEWALKCMATCHGPWIHVNQVGYKWRQHPGGKHHRGQSLQQLREKSDIIKAAWRKAGVKF